MPALADYRSDLDALLATAVDSSTWTTAIKDEGLRQALKLVDERLVYETTFTVTSTGYSQDLSGVTGLNEIREVAYPWTDGADWYALCVRWRYVDDQTIYFEDVEPQEDEKIRLRHTKVHTIENLDSAASTTLPGTLDRALAYGAGAIALRLRLRQMGENPAIADHAVATYRVLIGEWTQEFDRRLRRYQPGRNPNWNEIGMENRRYRRDGRWPGGHLG